MLTLTLIAVAIFLALFSQLMFFMSAMTTIVRDHWFFVVVGILCGAASLYLAVWAIIRILTLT